MTDAAADVKLVERRLPKIGARTFPFGLSWSEAGAMLASGLVFLAISDVVRFAACFDSISAVASAADCIAALAELARL